MRETHARNISLQVGMTHVQVSRASFSYVCHGLNKSDTIRLALSGDCPWNNERIPYTVHTPPKNMFLRLPFFLPLTPQLLPQDNFIPTHIFGRCGKLVWSTTSLNKTVLKFAFEYVRQKLTDINNFYKQISG